MAILHERIAYRGRSYVIEWYQDASGYAQALEYAEALADVDKKKLAALFMVMGDVGQIRNIQKFRSEGDKIYAFKPQPHRFLAFFYVGNRIIVTSAFVKKQDKLPINEKERALRCMKDYEARVKAGTYYEV